MDNMIIFFTFFILLVSALIYGDNNFNEVTYVKSSLDNKEYLVRKFENNKESIKSANMLAKIRYKLIKLAQHCYNKYPDDIRIKILKNRFNPNNITETGKNSKYTSYTVNKGDKIVMCLREKRGNNRLIDENTLTFVAVHEMSHIITKTIGHEKDFWENFKFMLNNAIEIGIYDNIDYSKEPKKYCGIVVTDNPLYKN